MCSFRCYTTTSLLHLFHSDSTPLYHPHSSLSKLLNILQNTTQFHYPFKEPNCSLWAMNTEWRIPTAYSGANQIRNSKSPIEKGDFFFPICICIFSQQKQLDSHQLPTNIALLPLWMQNSFIFFLSCSQTQILATSLQTFVLLLLSFVFWEDTSHAT